MRLLATMLLTAIALVTSTVADASAVGKVTTQVLEAVADAAAKRSGRSLDDAAARQVVVQQVEGLARTHGDDVLKLVEDGGLEFLEAIPKYGDDMVELASQASPQARRALALNPSELVPLSRRVGVQAIELEAKVPGQAKHVFDLFGNEGGRYLATGAPVEDLPRLIKYGEKADSDETRRLLLKAYRSEGTSLFKRIPPRLVLAGGLTAAIILGTQGSDGQPGFLERLLQRAMTVGGLIVFSVLVLLLWRFGLMPWHRRRTTPEGGTGRPKS